MLTWISGLGSLFWIPPIFWIALVCWARFLAYPVSLKRWIRRGKTWCYVPEWWSKALRRKAILAVLGVLSVCSAGSTSATVFWAAGGLPIPCLALLFAACLVIEKLVVEKAMDGVYRLEVNAYFLEYRRQSDYYGKSGISLSDEDLRGHAAWAFRHAMKKADAENRLFKHLKEMSALEIAEEREEAAYENA